MLISTHSPAKTKVIGLIHNNLGAKGGSATGNRKDFVKYTGNGR